MNVPSRFAPLMSSNPHRDRNRAIVRFLTEVWDYSPGEYTFLYTRRAGTDRMVGHPIQGDRADKVNDILDRYAPDDNDYYFCPNSFDRPQNIKSRALNTRYAWSDIDDADPMRFRPAPNILWETSRGRFQGLWVWKEVLEPREAERFSRGLWKLYGGDRGAWAANKLLRVPGTINHKPERSGDAVRLLRFDTRLKRIPDAIRNATELETPERDAIGLDPSKHPPRDVMRRYRLHMGLVAGTLMTARKIMHGDRSGAVFQIISAMVEAGAQDDEIAAVLLVNPYFASKWGDDVGEAERQILRIRATAEAGR